jgi:hypothetical protein
LRNEAEGMRDQGAKRQMLELMREPVPAAVMAQSVALMVGPPCAIVGEAALREGAPS